MIKKKKKLSRSKNTDKSYNFIEPISYFKNDFGKVNENVGVYSLNISCSQLLKDFEIFEDMNNVENWPISTLIQRELDHDRAKNIALDYLLKENNLKYFPPLTAVLIPTNDQYHPTEDYLPTSEIELKSFITKHFRGISKYTENDFEEPIDIVGGLYDIKFDEFQGEISWDKYKLTAVIIDGQHRLKSLKCAANIDKSFMDAMLNVTVIDLTQLSEQRKVSPTSLSRDLFVTINHTPEQISEARLCLMDDKDTLSTFTQVLVDDADPDNLPAVPPELMDWDCDGGKHKAESSLTGVLVLRQIINAALFDDIKLSTIDDRQNKRTVSKWLTKVDAWLCVDEVIVEKLEESETLRKRFELAEGKGGESDSEDEESLFLFSFSSKVSELLKLRFKELYLSSFRLIYDELEPYENIVNISKDYGVLTKNKELNKYYRAFKGRRRKLLDEKLGLRNEIEKYELEMKNKTKLNVLYTVMGQKSVFKALFSNYISQAETCEEAILEETNNFLEKFNDIYTIVTAEDCYSSNVFSTELTLTRGKKKDALAVGSSFWKGIILKLNGELDYSKAAIKILSTFICDLMDANEEGKPFEFTNKLELIRRHASYLKKLEIKDEDDERNVLARQVVVSKEKLINSIISKNS